MLLKAIAWLVPGGPIFAAIASVASAILKALAALLSAAFDGFTKMLANPATFVTAGLCVLVALAGGIKLGKEWDEHLVTRAEKRMTTAEGQRDDLAAKLTVANTELEQWKGRLDAETSAAEEARKTRDDAIARVKAEEAARKRAVAANARAVGLRDGAGPGAPAKGGPQDAPKTGVWGLPALSWPAQ
jgi:hypothetical protein